MEKVLTHYIHNYIIIDDMSFNSKIKELRAQAIKDGTNQNGQKLTCDTYTGMGVTTDIPTLNRYYIAFMNDVLNEIRHGRTSYVFNFQQVAELMKFEPNINVELLNGILCVNLKQ